MKLSYRLVHESNHYLAECIESDVMGEGKSSKEAVAALRAALAERMFRPDAVAPPSQPSDTTIELVLVDGQRAV